MIKNKFMLFLIILIFLMEIFSFSQFQKNPEIEKYLNHPSQEDYPESNNVIIKRNIEIILSKDGKIKKRVYQIIKIFSKNGIEKFSNLRVLYIKNKENVDFFQAGTYDTTGFFTPVEDIYETPVNYRDIYSKVAKFKNLDSGYIIEVGYKKNEMGKNLDGKIFLKDWYPILDEEITISIPQKKDLFFKLKNGEKILYESYLKNGYKIYHFHAKNLSPLIKEPQSPPEEYFSPLLIFSTYSSWQDRLKELLKKIKDIELTQKIQKTILELKKNSKKKWEVLENTFNTINNVKNIYIPFNLALKLQPDISKTLNLKKGTTLDKTILMYTILKSLNFDVKIFFFEKHKLEVERNIPALSQFNLMGLKITLGDKILYLNPFSEYSSFPYSPFINGNSVMLVSDKKISFEDCGKIAKNGFIINYDLYLEKNGDVKLQNKIKLWGEFSLLCRNSFNRIEKKEIEERINSYLNCKDLKFKMENIENLKDPAVLTIEGTLKKYGLKERKILFLELPPNIFPFTTIKIDTSLEKRKLPIYLGEPAKVTINYKIKLPENFIPLYEFKNFSYSGNSLKLTMKFKYNKKNNLIKVVKEIETLKRYSKPEEYEKLKVAISNFYKPNYSLLLLEGEENEN